jgi:hypothetical protein
MDDWRSLLVGLVKLYQRTTIVVDALDECENSAELLRNLMMLWDSADGAKRRIKFFFSSRTHVELPEKFPAWEKVELDSQKSLTVDDMETYVRTQVEGRETLGLGNRLLNGNYPKLEQRLIETLTSRAGGM